MESVRHPFQFFEQSLRFLQISRVKAFGEPTVDVSQALARVGEPPLPQPQTAQAGGCAQLEGAGAL